MPRAADAMRRRAALAAILLATVPWGADAAAQEALDTPLPAQVVAVRQTVLSAEIAGKIDRLPLREGDRFAKGDLLIGLDCAIQRAHLDEARAVLDAAETASAVHQRLQALNSASTLETELARAEAAKARAKLSSARTVVSKCTVKAPFAGRVVRRHVRAHQYVRAGQAVLGILDDSALEVDFILPSGWIPGVVVGQPVRFHVSETGATYDGTLARLGAKVDAVSHSLTAVATLDGPTPGLLPGMTGQVRLGE